MSRFSPTVLPTPSWTNAMAQATGGLTQALIQRRQMQQQQDQIDTQDAERGIFRGAAPAGHMTVNTPDFQINDRPGYDDGTATGSALPGQGAGPQVAQTSNPSVTFGNTSPLTASLLGARNANALPAPANGGATFNGPEGRGLADTSRYQQVPTKSGNQFYIDQTQTPHADAMALAHAQGDARMQGIMLGGQLRNEGIAMGGQLRNQGSMDRTNANIDSYGPGGARYQGAISKSQLQYGYMDDQGQYHPGSVPTGKVYTAAQEVPSKIAAGAPALGERTRHDRAMEARPVGSGRGASASDPTVRNFNAVGKQITQTNQAINQTTRQLSSPATMLDSTASSGLTQQLTELRNRRDSLTSVGDSLSGVMQHNAASPSGSATAPHVPRSGIEASSLTIPLSGANTPMVGNRTDQRTQTVSDRIPSSPTDASDSNNGGSYIKEANKYRNFVNDTQNDSTLSAREKSERLAKARDIYNTRVANIAQPKR